MTELFLAVHFLFILYLLAGLPLGLYYNNKPFRIIHAALLASVSLLMILGVPCPLTVLEESASGGSYEGSFIAYWLRQIVYLTWVNPKTVFWLDMAFAALTFSSFLWRPLSGKTGPR